MSNLVAHAVSELEFAFPKKEDQLYDGAIQESVIELMRVFANQGHSGGSAPIVTALFSKLASFEPLTPLTFADNEWFEHENEIFQNKRNSAVFKVTAIGKPYYIDAIIWRTQTGSTWSGSALL